MARTEIRDLEVEVAKEQMEQVVGGAVQIPYTRADFATDADWTRVCQAHKKVETLPAMTPGKSSRDFLTQNVFVQTWKGLTGL
jgi:hypothetical protein